LGALVVVPLTLLLCSILRAVPNTNALLHVVLPCADVLVPICVVHRALAVLRSVFEIAIESVTVSERKFALALEVVVVKLTFVSFVTVCEKVNAAPREHSILEVAIIVGSVRPLILTTSDLLSLMEVASVLDAAIVPGLFAVAVLLIIDPLAVRSTTL